MNVIINIIVFYYLFLHGIEYFIKAGKNETTCIKIFFTENTSLNLTSLQTITLPRSLK